MIQDTVYLDWAATAPLSAEAAEAMRPYNEAENNITCNANANSLHTPGRNAFAALEDARRQLAQSIGARRPDEVIFTSGATEANNTAIFGIVAASVKKKRLQGTSDFVPHIITSEIEHDAILGPCTTLRALGCEITYLKPDRQGFIEAKVLEQSLKDNTVLVSLQMVNNEIGSVNSVTELAALTHQAGALFHTDAVQALGRMPLNMEAIKVDAASFSSHKVGGPKGVGALYLKSTAFCDPLLFGGGQEEGRRSGTQNVGGAVGFAAACKKAVDDQEQQSHRLRTLRDKVIQDIADLPNVYPTVDIERGSFDFAPHIVHMCIENRESEMLILHFDTIGIAVSGGSACSSASLQPSHVLRALGIKSSLSQGALRISFGPTTSEEDLDAFVGCLRKYIQK